MVSLALFTMIMSLMNFIKMMIIKYIEFLIIMHMTVMTMTMMALIPEYNDSETDGHGHSDVHPHHTVDVSVGTEASVDTSIH